MTEYVEHEAADQIRRLLDEDERFRAVSGATAFRRADLKRGWTDAGFFSFERGGRLYFVTVEPVELTTTYSIEDGCDTCGCPTLVDDRCWGCKRVVVDDGRA